MRNVLLILAPLALAACATSLDTPIVDAEVVRDQGPVAVGEALRLGDVYVTPITVVEDSRCPDDVQCVWQGTVKVETRIDGAGWRETQIVEWQKPTWVRGHRIVLDRVLPDPHSGHRITLEDYRLSFTN